MFEDIITDRLIIRCLRDEDAAPMFAYRSLPEVLQYQMWEPKVLADVETFIVRMGDEVWNTVGWYQVAIASRQDNALLGDLGICLYEYDSRIAGVGITLAPQYQGKGYATEALTAVLSLLFDELKKHRVCATVDPRNRKSAALLERVGMRKEGHSIESLWFRGEWVDDAAYGMLEREWFARQK